MWKKIITSMAICLSFIACSLEAKEKKQTVCLNMIIKDEKAVITRCLATVKPLIDYWVIVDTGSSDGTQNIVREFMKDIPGELHERPWENFEHNRNEALELAKGKGDYILVIDADEIFAYDKDFKFPLLDKDYYHIMTDYNKTFYTRVQLVKNALDWKWEGVVHEAILCPQAKTTEVLKGLTNVVNTDGARSSDPKKYHKDAALLEKALKENPKNSRYRFYLAQSYRDAGDYENALKNYTMRLGLGGFDEEIFYSLLQIGLMKELLERNEKEVTISYDIAYRYRPTRAEPLYRLSNYLRRKNNYQAAYLVAAKGLKVPPSDDVLLVERWAWDYAILMEYSIAAYWLELFDEAKLASLLLLSNPNLPDNFREAVEKNLEYTERELARKEALELYKNL